MVDVRDVQVEVAVGWRGLSVDEWVESRESASASHGSDVTLLGKHHTL